MSATDHGPVREATPTTFYTDTVRIPGVGNTPDRCQPLKPVGVCDHGHAILGRSSCETRRCPDHWRDWCEEAVIAIVARLAAYREVQDGWGKRMVHAVASPPQDRRYSVRELWDTRPEAYDAFEEAGVRGGAVVTHPYRTTEEANRMFSKADVPDGTGKWRWLRDLAGDLEGDDWHQLEQYVEPAPHYHGLVAVEDMDGSQASNGWVVENIRSLEEFHYQETDTYEDMVRSAYYVLTHGAVQRGRSTTTYFGEVHPNGFDPREELTLTKWDRIQREAERAVRGFEEIDEEGEGGGGPEECPRDDCEARVRDLVHLPDLLEDDDWTTAVRTLRGGRKRLLRLRGVLAYWEGRTDRPPPSAATNQARFLEWLEERGRVLTPQPNQSFLNEALMG